ncbi:uncharacterized protein LOC110251751 [Exaiptasia diaphana]|uniref:Uncharacterized protein n=1 Tax=Exaiptasia diaphana TaxID=2652724 RepID=A0A913Y440_EXADI|nr:uncharacterized protein LOC110251751 [Exaiptasia diaphana]XP_028518832.1 uncharacterized protein LOC110251751 [Exaiptasia diaphana]
MMVSGLSTIVITTFLKVCTDVTSRRPVTIYRPQCPPGYCSLGDYAQETHSHAPNYGVTLCFRANNNSTLLARPRGFTQIWSAEHDGYDDAMSGSGSGSGSGSSESYESQKIVSFWRAIPPSDEYVSIGDMVTTNYEQPSTKMTCVVHKSLVTTANSGRRVWREHSGAASIWMTGRSDEYLDLRTFRTNDNKDDPGNFRALILEVLPPPHDGTFIKRTIRGNDLKLLYKYQNGEAYESVNIYVPQPPPGFVPLGFYAQKGHKRNQDAQVTVVKVMTTYGSRLMLTPAGYRKVMEYNDHHNNSILTYWRPISAPGYYCMGDIVTINQHNVPSSDTIACLHWSLVMSSQRGSRIWWSKNHPYKHTHTKNDFTLWGVGGREFCESPNTFIAHPGFVTPPSERLLFHCLPNQGIEI